MKNATKGNTMKNFNSTSVQALLLTALVCSALTWFTPVSRADERTLTPEQVEQLATSGELTSNTNARPAKLPDLTKGDPADRSGEAGKINTWNLGPTGIIGYMSGGLKGDQIEVDKVLPNSPAQGKLQWGDVILGVNGTRFSAGQNMGMLLGKQIIEAERPVNKGALKLIVWRDANFAKRNGKKDVVNVDIDSLINKAASDNSLYEWKPEKEKTKEIRSSNFDEFPIKSKLMEITLTLAVLPEYSDTSPYDCPKAERIRENAWKVLEAQFKSGKVRANRTGTIMALALVASGKPEHRKMIRDWVRSPAAKAWHPSVEGSIDMMKPRGYFSWFMSFDALDCALYYDATGDDFVLPAMREYAIKTAMGQAGGGSWGHTFAWPTFNGGELHGMNPGYGALNAAGNRCFFLIALAKKHGIKHPEIELANKRAHKFFGSFIDKGAIPYGMHGAAASDDSNGKNVGVAFALKLLGDHHGAKYFAQMSTHASFTRRAGHGNDYFWHYSPWAATLCGPEGTIATHRNMRWRFTLNRRFDGAFVIQSPTGGIQSLRDPTATFALHYSAPLKQTLLTGKDFDTSYAWSAKGLDHLMTSALPQLNDETLIKKSGTPYAERTTNELFKQLDMFKPKARGIYARLLGKRYLEGEKEILPRLVKLLDSDEPRLRDGACKGLAACGNDATLKYMSKVAKLLNDPREFVRMQAMVTMTKASNSVDTKLALLNATIAERKDESASPNNFPAWVQNPLFGEKESKLAESPFDAGFDESLVQAALEKLLELDPIGNRGFLRTRAGVWSKDTVIRLAGPLTYVAENEQTSDQMFSSRHVVGQVILAKHGYREAIEASANYLYRNAEIPRDIRPLVHFKREFVNPDVIKKKPGLCTDMLPSLKLWLADNPIAMVAVKKGEKTEYTKAQDLVTLVAAATSGKQAKSIKSLPSLAGDVSQFYQTKLAQLEGNSAKIIMCREELNHPARRNYFRKIAALNYLVDTLALDAIKDVVPYIAHDYWRLRDHARFLAVRLARTGGTKQLITEFAKSEGETAASILAVLGEADAKEAIETAMQGLQHEAAIVRHEAVQAVFKLGGDSSLEHVFAFMQSAATSQDLRGCEKALLARRTDASHAQRVRTWAIATIDKATAKSEAPLRHALYWVLARLGGDESLATLQHAAAETGDDAEFRMVANCLSWSPDPRASQVLLSIVKENLKTNRAKIAANEGVRRMVIGANDIGTLSNKQRLDYAEKLLNMVLDKSTVTYLGSIKSGRCAFILQRVMRRGVTDTAAKAIISATTDLTGTTVADRKLAESALIDTIEFIEVTQLRGGATERMAKDPQGYKSYPMWKALAAQAGKNLIKLSKPGKEPLPEFNDNDLDL